MANNPTIFRDTIEQPQQDRAARAVDALALVLPGTRLSEPRLQDNGLNLTDGQYPFYRQVRDNLVVRGMALTQVAGMETARRAMWQGCRFNEPVSLGATANVRFQGCRFDQAVVIAAGGRASFQDCHFVQNVQNAGLAAAVGILGCTRQGAAHVNCTVVFEI